MNKYFLNDQTKIIDWLDDHHIENYTLMPDSTYGHVVDVMGDVSLFQRNLSHIPVKFGSVTGDFLFYQNQLTDLAFCPQSVGGTFNCGNNRLTSLVGSPQSVGENFLCWHNKLHSLRGCASQITADFYCNNNSLTSLEFGPQRVGGDFCCNNNHLLTLDFLPLQNETSYFECHHNPALGDYQKSWKHQTLRQKLDIETEHLSLNEKVKTPNTTLKNNYKI